MSIRFSLLCILYFFNLIAHQNNLDHCLLGDMPSGMSNQSLFQEITRLKQKINTSTDSLAPLIDIALLCNAINQATKRGISFPTVDAAMLKKLQTEVNAVVQFVDTIDWDKNTLESFDTKIGIAYLDTLESFCKSMIISFVQPLDTQQGYNDSSDTLISTKWYTDNVGSNLSLSTFYHYWCYDHTNPARKKIRQHIAHNKYQSMLDVGCGMCVEYEGFKHDGYSIKYHGIDVVPELIDQAVQKNIPARIGSIEALPFNDNSFDIVYTRWVLESLPYYEKAVDELIRVAAKEALVIFFIKPTSEHPDQIQGIRWPEPYLYYNCYNKEKLEHYILSHAQVETIEWEELPDSKGVALHIFLD